MHQPARRCDSIRQLPLHSGAEGTRSFAEQIGTLLKNEISPAEFARDAHE
jgi:hypothetical protein